MKVLLFREPENFIIVKGPCTIWGKALINTTVDKRFYITLNMLYQLSNAKLRINSLQLILSGSKDVKV